MAEFPEVSTFGHPFGTFRRELHFPIMLDAEAGSARLAREAGWRPPKRRNRYLGLTERNPRYPFLYGKSSTGGREWSCSRLKKR